MFFKSRNNTKNFTPVFTSGGSRISPRRGRQLPGGGGKRQHMILQNFPKKCMKLKNLDPRGRGGARLKFYYVDQPLFTII